MTDTKTSIKMPRLYHVYLGGVLREDRTTRFFRPTSTTISIPNSKSRPDQASIEFTCYHPHTGVLISFEGMIASFVSETIDEIVYGDIALVPYEEAPGPASSKPSINRVAPAQTAPTFKAGDTVRLKRNMYGMERGCAGLSRKTEYVVAIASSGNQNLQLKGVSGRNYLMLFFEKLPDPKPDPKPGPKPKLPRKDKQTNKFKVGDEVWLVDGCRPPFRLLAGQVYHVSHLFGSVDIGIEGIDNIAYPTQSFELFDISQASPEQMPDVSMPEM